MEASLGWMGIPHGDLWRLSPHGSEKFSVEISLEDVTRLYQLSGGSEKCGNPNVGTMDSSKSKTSEHDASAAMYAAYLAHRHAESRAVQNPFRGLMAVHRNATFT